MYASHHPSGRIAVDSDIPSEPALALSLKEERVAVAVVVVVVVVDVEEEDGDGEGEGEGEKEFARLTRCKFSATAAIGDDLSSVHTDMTGSRLWPRSTALESTTGIPESSDEKTFCRLLSSSLVNFAVAAFMRLFFFFAFAVLFTSFEIGVVSSSTSISNSLKKLYDNTI